MQKRTKIAFVVGIIFCENLFASSFTLDNIYLGFDALKSNYATKENVGSNIFAKNPTSFNIFVGYNLSNNFFLEAGYETKLSKGRNAYLETGDVFPPAGPALLPATQLTTYSKFNTQLPYLGVGFNHAFPKLKNTFVSVTVGGSLVKVQANYAITYDNIIGIYTQTQMNTSRQNFCKKKFSPLIKLSLNHVLDNNVGVRVTGTWHRLNNFRINSQQITRTEIRLKNSLAVGIGAFYTF